MLAAVDRHSRPGDESGVVGYQEQHAARDLVRFAEASDRDPLYDFLEHVSLRIINEVDGISRVTYDISGKPPATIEWE